MFCNQVISQLLVLAISLCVVEFVKPQPVPTTTDAVGGQQDGVNVEADQP